jgi:hypothetical protein
VENKHTCFHREHRRTGSRSVSRSVKFTCFLAEGSRPKIVEILIFSIFFFYFLFSMFYVLRSMFYVLRSTFYVLRSIFYFLFSIFYFLFSIFYFLFSILL